MEIISRWVRLSGGVRMNTHGKIIERLPPQMVKRDGECIKTFSLLDQLSRQTDHSAQYQRQERYARYGIAPLA